MEQKRAERVIDRALGLQNQEVKVKIFHGPPTSDWQGDEMKKRKKSNLPRVPLPRQTGGAHTADKGGKYNRKSEREKSRKEIRAELE